MTPKVEKMYRAATRDPIFMADLLEADGDDLSKRHDEIERNIVASMYYGYLVGKQGVRDWKIGLNL